MATTETEVVNLGFDLIGEASILDILAPTNERGEIANRQYFNGRDALLRRFTWLFSRKWFSLSADDDATLDPDRAVSYQLPAEAVRVLRPSDVEWVVNGRKIYSSVTGPLKVQVLRNDMPVSDFDPLFVQALAAYVVLRTIEKRTQSANKQQLLRVHYKDAIADAVNTNALEEPTRVAFRDHASLYLAGHDGVDAVT